MNFITKHFDNAKYRIEDSITDLDAEIKKIQNNIELQKTRINKVNDLQMFLYNNFELLKTTLNELHLELYDYKILTSDNVHNYINVEIELSVVTLPNFEYIDYDYDTEKEYYQDDEYHEDLNKKLNQKAEIIENFITDAIGLRSKFYSYSLKTFKRKDVKLKISLYAK